MKYVDEYRGAEEARRITAEIARTVLPDRQYRFMEFCGGHTHVISRWGLEDVLPPAVHMIHGPGCPVCVLPIGRIDMAIELALQKGVILCTYADTLRVPASKGLSLFSCRAQGGAALGIGDLKVWREGERGAVGAQEVCAEAVDRADLGACAQRDLAPQAAVFGG